MNYFPTHAAEADTAATVLMALGSMARIDPKGPGLLPCRIHNFFRGLPGLWVCMDAALQRDWPQMRRAAFAARCTASRGNDANAARACTNSITCRFCGTAYARAYTDDVDSPSALWSEPGQRLRMDGGETSPLTSARHAA